MVFYATEGEPMSQFWFVFEVAMLLVLGWWLVKGVQTALRYRRKEDLPWFGWVFIILFWVVLD